MGLPGLIERQMEVIQEETERWMDVCGSSGKGVEG
jgi:fructose-bisphosphate aldolase class II